MFSSSSLNVTQPPPSFLELSLHFSILELVRYPAPQQIPADWVDQAKQICDLLANGPIAGVLIPKTLNLPDESVFHILDMLYVLGCLRPTDEREAAHFNPSLPPSEAPGAPHTGGIRKLWQRLAGKH